MNDINFFSIYSSKNSAAFKRDRMLKIGLIIVVIIILLYAGLFTWLHSTEAKTQEINDYLMTDKIQNAITIYNTEMSMLTAIQEYNNSAAGLVDSMKNVKNLSTDTLAIISKSIPVNAIVENMNYSDNIFTFNMKAPSMLVVAQTQVRLQQTELFAEVALSGATINEGKNGYNYTVTAMMKVGGK